MTATLPCMSNILKTLSGSEGVGHLMLCWLVIVEDIRLMEDRGMKRR